MKKKDSRIMSWDRESSRSWSESRHGDWHGHRHGGNWWIAPVVILGLIVLTHGWILVVPLIALAAFAFFGFVLPRLAMMHNMHGEWRGDWNRGDWAQWQEKRKHHIQQHFNHHFQEWGEAHRAKNKRHFQNWGGDSARWSDDKSKRKNSDDIEYV
jgi:hypothetical protein